MTEVPSPATDLSRAILDKALGKQVREPATALPRPTTFAERVQDAIDQGATLDQIRRHFHLGETELQDYCADIMDDDFDDPSRSPGSGY